MEAVLMDFKPKPGSFAPYLEYAQRDKQAPTPASPLTLLEILARQVQTALPLPDLQTLSGMDAARYRMSLKNLRDAGYVTIDGPTLEELVKLTEQGAGVARLAQPA
jgi:hypothetical protein